MKIVRCMAFMLSLLVIIGHDVIGHIHQEDAINSPDLASIASTTSARPVDIEQLLALLQHPASARQLVYLHSAAKSLDLKHFHSLALLVACACFALIASPFKERRWASISKFKPPRPDFKYPSFRAPPAAARVAYMA